MINVHLCLSDVHFFSEQACWVSFPNPKIPFLGLIVLMLVDLCLFFTGVLFGLVKKMLKFKSDIGFEKDPKNQWMVSPSTKEKNHPFIRSYCQLFFSNFLIAVIVPPSTSKPLAAVLLSASKWYT